MKRYVLFGAGAYVLKTVELLGEENIETILDNDTLKWGTQIKGIPVCNPEEKRESLKDYQIIISVSKKYQSQISEQLRQWNVKDVRTIQAVQAELPPFLYRTSYKTGAYHCKQGGYF